MLWYRTLNQALNQSLNRVPNRAEASRSWDPTPNESSPPGDVVPAGLSLSMPITKKKDKMRPGGKKRKIRWPTTPYEPGQALGPAVPQDAARPNAASSDPRDLRGI